MQRVKIMPVSTGLSPERTRLLVSLCAAKGVAEAHYALEGLPNRVLAAEYRTVLPDEKLLAEELVRTRRQVGVRPPQEMPLA
jgi:hypothetical protein